MAKRMSGSEQGRKWLGALKEIQEQEKDDFFSFALNTYVIECNRTWNGKETRRTISLSLHAMIPLNLMLDITFHNVMKCII